jgi:hypothetical protein
MKYDTVTLPIPLGGLNKRDEPTLMNRMTSPDMFNVEVDDSMIVKRRGYASMAQWGPLNGTGMDVLQYIDGQGTTHLIALTTTHAYEYSHTLDLWQTITPNTLLDACETAWTSGGNTDTAQETTIYVRGSASTKATCTDDVGSGSTIQSKLLAASVDLSTHTQLGFWLRSNTAYGTGQFSFSIVQEKVAFTNGSHAPVIGETLTGGTSGETAVIIGVTVDSGAWGTSDAAGSMYFHTVSGVFQAEELQDGDTNDVCDIAADITRTTSVVTTDTAITADTWHFFSMDDTLTAFTGVGQLFLATGAGKTTLDTTLVYLDDVRGYTEFTGSDTDRWSYDEATNPYEFTANGGTALVLCNGVDDLFAYEGILETGLTTLTPSSELTSFATTREIFEFWNHLYLGDYDASSVTYSRSLAWHDVPSASNPYVDLGITETVLTDSRGTIKRIVKLGYEAVVYNDFTISVIRRIGGGSLFIFPTIVFETGLIAPRAVVEHVNTHFFLGNDLRVYSYRGGIQIKPIGEQIEDWLFDEIDAQQLDYVVSGLDPRLHKIYFIYPQGGVAYAYNYVAYNFDRQGNPWEAGKFSHPIAGFSLVSNTGDLRCDSQQLVGITCDDDEWGSKKCSDGSWSEGYPEVVMIDRDGNTYKRSDGATTDAGTGYTAYFSTPDLIPIEGRTDEEARFLGFNFSAQSTTTDSNGDPYNLRVNFSEDGGETWTLLETVTLSSGDTWTQHRVPCDFKAKRGRFRLGQGNVDGDFKVRSMSYKIQKATDR